MARTRPGRSKVPGRRHSGADLDLFIDEDIGYARRLRQADVPAEPHTCPGGIHGFGLLAPGPALAQRFIRDRGEALRRAFRR